MQFSFFFKICKSDQVLDLIFQTNHTPRYISNAIKLIFVQLSYFTNIKLQLRDKANSLHHPPLLLLGELSNSFKNTYCSNSSLTLIQALAVIVLYHNSTMGTQS